MKKRNGTTVADLRNKRRLVELLKVLQTLDVERYRAVVGATDATDDQILEALHRTRLEHPGVNQSQRKASLRWLDGREV